MNITTKMQKAIGAFKWAEVEAEIQNIPGENLNARIAIVLDTMLRDGYLILRRPDQDYSTRRDAFLSSFRAFAAANGAEGQFTTREGRFESARLTEMVYHEVLSSVRTKVLSQIGPEDLVFATLRHCESCARELISATTSPKSPKTGYIDPVAGKIHVESAGGAVNPDQLLNTLVRTMTSTIKMLAYELKWFADDGVIDIPGPILTEAIPDETVYYNRYLAEVWSQVERSDGRCRYFGGTVTQIEPPIDATLGHSIKVVRFNFPDAGELSMHAAGERVKWMFTNFNRGLDRNPNILAKMNLPEPTPLAPIGYVSISEANAAIALSHVLFTSVSEIEKEFGGLTLVEWLRGYSVLQKAAATHLQKSQSDEYALFTSDEMTELLCRAGLAPEKAVIFMRNVTFGKNSDDVFDAPLIRCADGHLFLVSSAAMAFHPAFVIMSRLASLHCDLSWKGKALEADVVTLFREHGIPAAPIYRQIDGEECEVDCVVVWQGILFVFECKNLSLPGDNPQAEFWFIGEQNKAARQARKKAEILSRHAEVVATELGIPADWDQVVAVVLNGAPYSLPGPIDGVYSYDASALHRFFENGQLVIRLGDQLLPGTTVSLWAGSRPNAQDLLNQLVNPEQAALILRHFGRSDIKFPASETLMVSTIQVDRQPSLFETAASV